MSQSILPAISSPVSNPAQSKCFTHCHMTATEYAIWSVCRAMASAQNGVVYFSGPKIAAKFRSMGKNVPYSTVQSLSAMGWFKKVKESQKRANNTFTPTHYRVLTHEEWAAEHPSCCVKPSLDEGSPYPSEGTEDQIQDNSPSLLKGGPSLLKGTNLYNTTNANTPVSLSPSLLKGMELIDRYGGTRKSRQRGNASAQVVTAQPSPLKGTDPSSPVSESEAMAHSLIESLGVTNSNSEKLWRIAIDDILKRGHDRSTILAVAKFCAEKYGATAMERAGSSNFNLGFTEFHKLMVAEKGTTNQ